MEYKNATLVDGLETILINYPTFIMLVGCPGSGKSTFAKQLKSYADDKAGFKIDIVNPDDIREELCGDRTDQSKNSEVFSEVHSRIGTDLANNVNVIYDATNAYSKFRTQIMSTVTKYDCTKICVVMNTDLLNSINQNFDREISVDTKIIERMYLSIMNKTPSLNEGFDMVVRY